jgi:glycerate kinase
MKKIIIAADSFKGSVTSKEVADSVESGIKSVFANCEVEKVYIADGGEGTVEALVSSLRGEFVYAPVSDPLMRPITAKYGIINNGETAVIEMAAASGLPLLTPKERNPLKTSTYGTGELILDALRRGCKRLLIGIGGSATNDAGTGMLTALGVCFFDVNNNKLEGTGENLQKINRIDTDSLNPLLKEVEITIACDVTNPFSGINGAAYVFAPQKGADNQMVEELDKGLKHFAALIKSDNGSDIDSMPGAGAAGGLGGAFVAFLNAKLEPGVEMVLDAVKFATIIKNADMIITGEGKLDSQTAMGKAPCGVLNAAKKAGIPVVAIGGSVENADILNQQGFAGVFPILPRPATLEEAMNHDYTRENIQRTVHQLMSLIKNLKK